MARRAEQVEQEIAHLAGDFLAREGLPAQAGGVKALITVTHADVAPNFKRATIYLSVLPQTSEKDVMVFTRRMRSGLREYIGKNSFFRPAPIVDFEIDYGEKNRQRIDELTRKKNA